MFDGFRLDNAHSTPVNMCAELMQCARNVNKNLFIMAELFTSSETADADFVRRIGINGLVREIQNVSNNCLGAICSTRIHGT